MNYPRSLVFAALLLLLNAAPVVAQNFEKGLEAARAGDFAAAVAQWRPLAANGHVEAQFNIGAIYEEGLGVPKDPSEAAGWYGLAASQGHAQAQYNMGVLYADGRGVPRDDARAAEWWRKAADQDHGKAQYNLGIFYQLGRGLRKDLSKAQFWFDRAAANGVNVRGDSGRQPDKKVVSDTARVQPKSDLPSTTLPQKPKLTSGPKPAVAAVNVASVPAG
ncbi:MAG: sel1 repeat family protein, partial [Alphaproteobacteria bacterium]|nr:sel1 repeat family protein [Alphaproteobacteria bacterium]